MIKENTIDTDSAGVLYMSRCLSLATRAGTDVRANPNVGAVISYQGKVIGEGWHRRYGDRHAEIEALASVSPKDRQYLKSAHLYVSLEPCNHHGKTPPCVDAILQAGIPQVTIGCLDPNPLMSGQSIEILRSHGVMVHPLYDPSQSQEIITPFYIQQRYKRPYILLKYAVTKDGYIGQEGKSLWLTNKISQLNVHLTRTQVDAIMIGTTTAVIDNPQLTTRLIDGRSPLRIVLDREGRIPSESHVLTDKNPSWIFTTLSDYPHDALRRVFVLPRGSWELSHILQLLWQQGVCRLMIEGGASLLTSLIKAQLWDQCHLYQSSQKLNAGIKAPHLIGHLNNQIQLGDNKLLIINNLQV